MFVRMFLLFSIPLALLAAVSFVSYTIYTNQLRDDLFNEYGENLNQLAGRIAVTLEELNRSVLFLREFDDIAMVLAEVGDARKIDPRVLNRAARALSNYGHTREIVASIWIYFRESGLVLSSGGTASDSFFFGEPTCSTSTILSSGSKFRFALPLLWRCCSRLCWSMTSGPAA